MSSFFHTIVVFGASAALTGCGGNAVDSTGTPDKGAGGASGSGGPGNGGTGGISFGTAGSATGTGGAGGAAPSDGGTGIAIPDPGTLAQWDCDLSGGCTAARSGIDNALNLTAPCAIDSTRPRFATECRSDQWFACDLAYFEGVEVHVRCACTVRDDAGCASVCNPYTHNYSIRETVIGCAENVKICGCAYTGITR